MKVEELERQGLIRRLPSDPQAVENAMNLARRDVAVAGSVLADNSDWAYTIAYNAMLQAGQALMFSNGYRPAGKNQHISVVKFAELFLDGETVLAFDRMRRKRHITVYDLAGTVSEEEARNAVSRAAAFSGCCGEASLLRELGVGRRYRPSRLRSSPASPVLWRRGAPGRSERYSSSSMKVEFADSSGEFNQDVDVAYGRLLAASSSLRVARTLSCEWMGDHLPGGRLRLWMAGENGSFQIFEFFSFN